MTNSLKMPLASRCVDSAPNVVRVGDNTHTTQSGSEATSANQRGGATNREQDIGGSGDIFDGETDSPKSAPGPSAHQQAHVDDGSYTMMQVY